MRGELLLWFIDCSNGDDWYDVEVATSYEHASAWRRLADYRPLPLVMVEGWTNDVWYKPPEGWDEMMKQEVVDWETELFIHRWEQAEIYQKAVVTP